jgi:hypothetical protein
VQRQEIFDPMRPLAADGHALGLDLVPVTTANFADPHHVQQGLKRPALISRIYHLLISFTIGRPFRPARKTDRARYHSESIFGAIVVEIDRKGDEQPE